MTRKRLEGPPPGWNPFADVDLEAEPFGEEGRMDDHANAGPPPSGACAHGVPGSSSCSRCEAEALEAMRRANAMPRFTSSGGRGGWPGPRKEEPPRPARTVLRLVTGDDAEPVRDAR